LVTSVCFCAGINSEKLRKQASTVPKENLQRAALKAGERRLHYTVFRFHFSSLSLHVKTNYDLNDRAQDTRDDKNNKAVINVVWEGWGVGHSPVLIPESFSQNETSTFQWVPSENDPDMTGINSRPPYISLREQMTGKEGLKSEGLLVGSPEYGDCTWVCVMGLSLPEFVADFRQLECYTTN
jgi:hypothetical protein